MKRTIYERGLSQYLLPTDKVELPTAPQFIYQNHTFYRRVEKYVVDDDGVRERDWFVSVQAEQVGYQVKHHGWIYQRVDDPNVLAQLWSGRQTKIMLQAILNEVCSLVHDRKS